MVEEDISFLWAQTGAYSDKVEPSYGLRKFWVTSNPIPVPSRIHVVLVFPTFWVLPPPLFNQYVLMNTIKVYVFES
jgi:hypothetical protein